MTTNVTIDTSKTQDVFNGAVDMAQKATEDINKVLTDISGDNIIGADPNSAAKLGGLDVLGRYEQGVTVGPGGISITSAGGAMVIDDLMQKISTKVQVAAQLLSTANNISKTASRIMSQG